MRSVIVAAVVALAAAGCSKKQSPPFAADDARWAQIATRSKPLLVVAELRRLDSVDALLALHRGRAGLASTCDTPAPAATAQIVTEALARASGPSSPELQAVVYLARLLRNNGSGAISLMLGSYVARRVVDWARQRGLDQLPVRPLGAEAEVRSIAADVRCVWTRYQAGEPRKGGLVLRGYLEAIATATDVAAVQEHQRRAFVFSAEIPALAGAPRRYDHYLSAARAHREAFNRLAR